MCLDAENTVSLRESRAREPGPEEPGPEGVTSAGFPELMASLRLRLRATAGFLTATSSVNLQAVPMAMVAAMEMPLNAPSLAAAAVAAMSKAAGPGPKAVPPRPGPVDDSAHSSSSGGPAVGKVTTSGSSGGSVA